MQCEHTSMFPEEYTLISKLLTQHHALEAIWSASHLSDVEIVVVSDRISAKHHCPTIRYEKEDSC